MYRIQYGPTQGYDSAMVILRSKDQFDKVTAFYDTVIKNNKWGVAANDRSPDNYSWTLGSEEGDEGLVQITRDPKSNVVTIVLDRVRKK